MFFMIVVDTKRAVLYLLKYCIFFHGDKNFWTEYLLVEWMSTSLRNYNIN